MLRMIFAIASSSSCSDFAFGLNDGLPWPHNSEDMRWFRQYTRNSTVCCSEKTAKTLPESVYTTQGRSLFILKRGMTYYDLPKDAVIVGGAKIIEAWHSLVDEISISHLDGVYNADVLFPFEIFSDIVYDRRFVFQQKIDSGLITLYR